jgi:CheY-like chemotaxis protein
MPGDTGEVGHILVVDDDAAVRQTITNYLARLRLRPTRRVALWLRSPVHDELW